MLKTEKKKKKQGKERKGGCFQLHDNENEEITLSKISFPLL